MINKFIRIDFPENFLMPWLGKTSKMLRMFLKINFQEHGFDLTHEQFILIAHLYHRDGINQKDLDLETESIYSAASCTTNAISPILKVINDKYISK